jgi:hypothetical protein
MVMRPYSEVANDFLDRVQRPEPIKNTVTEIPRVLEQTRQLFQPVNLDKLKSQDK